MLNQSGHRYFATGMHVTTYTLAPPRHRQPRRCTKISGAAEGAGNGIELGRRGRAAATRAPHCGRTSTRERCAALCSATAQAIAGCVAKASKCAAAEALRFCRRVAWHFEKTKLARAQVSFATQLKLARCILPYHTIRASTPEAG